jgi:hypothetical protein
MRVSSGWPSGPVAIAVAIVAAACAATGRPSAASMPASEAVTGTAASCVGLTPAQQLRAARTVFDGTMLSGRVVGSGKTAVLNSPARVRVIRYVKGSGPRTVRVQTAVRATRNGVTGSSEGIEPRAGQRWRIFTDSRRQPFATTICSGSRRLGPMR